MLMELRTYLALMFQSLKSLFIIIENRVHPSPLGYATMGVFHSDKVLPVHTAWVLLVRKDFIQSERVILLDR